MQCNVYSAVAMETLSMLLTINVLSGSTIEGEPCKPQDEDSEGRMLNVLFSIVRIHPIKEASANTKIQSAHTSFNLL